MKREFIIGQLKSKSVDELLNIRTIRTIGKKTINVN